MEHAVEECDGEKPAVALDVKYNYNDGRVIISSSPSPTNKMGSPGTKSPQNAHTKSPTKPPLKPSPSTDESSSTSKTKKHHIKGIGFLGTTASSSFRRRAALDRIQLFSQTKTQSKDDNSSSYVLVGGGIRQISPASKAVLHQRQYDLQEQESRILFASDDTSICSLASSMASPARPRASSISSTASPAPKSTTKTTEISKHIPFAASAPTLSSASKQRPAVHTPVDETRAVNLIRHCPPSHISSGSLLVTPSPLTATAALRKKIQAARTASRQRRKDHLSIPALSVKTPPRPAVRTPSSSPVAKVVSSPRRASPTLHTVTTSPRHEERSRSPAARQPTKPSRIRSSRHCVNEAVAVVSPSMPVQAPATNSCYFNKQQSLTPLQQTEEDSPKGDDWAGVYSYFCDPNILGETTALDTKPENSSPRSEEGATGAIVTPTAAVKEFLVLPVTGEINDPEDVYGTMASFEKGAHTAPGTPTSLEYSSGGDSSSSSQTSGPYKMFAAESQPDDEFWSRATLRATSPLKTDDMTTMELIHHASSMLRVYFATLALQRWWFDILSLRQREQQRGMELSVQTGAEKLTSIVEVNESTVNEEEAQWEDFNLIGAAMTLQDWWTRVSPTKQCHERMDFNADRLVRCVSPESVIESNAAVAAEPMDGSPIKDALVAQPTEATTDAPVIAKATTLIQKTPPQTNQPQPSEMRYENLESRAALAQGALEVRIRKTSKKIEECLGILDSGRGRVIHDQRMAFFSAVDDLSRLQKQNISLWKARYSRGEKVRAAQVLQGWWRLLRTATQHRSPESPMSKEIIIAVFSATTLQNWWRMIVAQRNYDHFSCVVTLLPRRTKDIMLSKIQGPNLWGSLTRSRIKNQMAS